MLKIMENKILVCEFEFRAYWYVHSRNSTLEKVMDPFSPSFIVYTVRLLDFYLNGFIIK